LVFIYGPYQIYTTEGGGGAPGTCPHQPSKKRVDHAYLCYLRTLVQLSEAILHVNVDVSQTLFLGGLKKGQKRGVFEGSKKGSFFGVFGGLGGRSKIGLVGRLKSKLNLF
jgi:hypothetical protein